jgi:hypothetical protein
MNSFKLATIVSCVAALTACGGGGGGGGSDTPTTPQASGLNFPLQSGYKNRIANGSTDNFQISGTCTGTANQTASTPTSSTFEGNPGLSITQTTTTQFSNCTPSSNASTTVAHYDTNYSILGFDTAGGSYTVIAGATPQLPATVRVGDTAVFGTLNVFSNSTKATKTGQRIISYVVEPDGANTAIINLITKELNTSSQLLFTQQSRFRIAADGTLTPISIDVQYSTTSTNHLVYTKV